jgi:hypothetical protein
MPGGKMSVGLSKLYFIDEKGKEVEFKTFNGLPISVDVSNNDHCIDAQAYSIGCEPLELKLIVARYRRVGRHKKVPYQCYLKKLLKMISEEVRQ